MEVYNRSDILDPIELLDTLQYAASATRPWTNLDTLAGSNPLPETDSLSWKDKSWVIGIKAGDKRKAYDWNQLKTERLIHDKIDDTPILLVLANDNKSFFAFERPNAKSVFTLSNDTLTSDDHHYRIDGYGIGSSFSLKPLPAYQEFWHSWRTFNPNTSKY